MLVFLEASVSRECDTFEIPSHPVTNLDIQSSGHQEESLTISPVAWFHSGLCFPTCAPSSFPGVLFCRLLYATNFSSRVAVAY
ncbi:hypothetical protein E2C01_046794 [Portunus trituberculatus]|uniref:Uncharacterized protein n=1 Tax=Portunus trituberculatus TaxID=210409 RepID=A0A5B7G8Q8_PORTR|nr:hypothetical protein [Portunus trituberculatus]